MLVYEVIQNPVIPYEFLNIDERKPTALYAVGLRSVLYKIIGG